MTSRSSQDALRRPRGRRSILDFENQDEGVQHNVAIYRDESAAEVALRGRPSWTAGDGGVRRAGAGRRRRTSSDATCIPQMNGTLEAA